MKAIPQSVRQQIALTPKRPERLSLQDQNEFMDSLPPGCQTEGEELWAMWVDQRDDAVVSMVWDISRKLEEMAMYMKPILTVSEGAAIIGVSTKRFANIISKERSRLGRLPDYVCDGDGAIQRRIIKAKLLDWVEQCKKRRVPPFRNRRGGTA